MSAQSDTLNFNKIKINDLVSLEQSSEQVFSNLGIPKERKPYFNEIEDITMEQVTIRGSNFYFLDNKLDSFEITSSFFFVYNPSIRIGNSINSLKDIFPKSFLFKREVNSKGFMDIQLYSDDIGLMDLYLLITFDVNTKLITEISLWSPS